jgi:hypothetical protein
VPTRVDGQSTTRRRSAWAGAGVGQTHEPGSGSQWRVISGADEPDWDLYDVLAGGHEDLALRGRERGAMVASLVSRVLLPSYSFRSFKREHALAFEHYVRKARIARSQKMLSNTALGITSIVRLSGFTNRGCFYRVVQSIAGVTSDGYVTIHNS